MKKQTNIVQDTQYVIKLMRETLFGHRVLTYSKKDTDRLRNKVKEPWTDKEREDHVNTVEPLMNKKQFVMPGVEPDLDRALDLDTRVSRSDYFPNKDNDEEKEDDDIDTQLGNINISNLK